MKRGKITKLLALAMTAGVLFTGCGNATAGTTEVQKSSAVEQTDSTEVKEEENTAVTDTVDAATDTTADTATDTAEAPAELTKVRYAAMTGANTLWFGLIGQETGIFEKYGLDVEITEFASGIETVDSITMDQADIGFVTDFAGLNRFGNTQGRSDIKFFEEQSRSGAYALYVNPEKISTIEDLKGKKVLVVKGTFLEYLNAVTAEQGGFTMADVEEVPVSGMPDAFAAASSGGADAMWTAGDGATKLAELGWTPIKRQTDIGIFTYTFHVASNQYLTDNAETVQKFIQAYEEVNQYTYENQDEAAEIINAKTGYDPELFKKVLAASEVKAELTQEAVDALVKVDEWAVNNGYYSPNLNVTDYINSDALKAVFPENVTY